MPRVPEVPIGSSNLGRTRPVGPVAEFDIGGRGGARQSLGRAANSIVGKLNQAAEIARRTREEDDRQALKLRSSNARLSFQTQASELDERLRQDLDLDKYNADLSSLVKTSVAEFDDEPGLQADLNLRFGTSALGRSVSGRNFVRERVSAQKVDNLNAGTAQHLLDIGNAIDPFEVGISRTEAFREIDELQADGDITNGEQRKFNFDVELDNTLADKAVDAALASLDPAELKGVIESLQNKDRFPKLASSKRFDYLGRAQSGLRALEQGFRKERDRVTEKHVADFELSIDNDQGTAVSFREHLEFLSEDEIVDGEVVSQARIDGGKRNELERKIKAFEVRQETRLRSANKFHGATTGGLRLNPANPEDLLDINYEYDENFLPALEKMEVSPAEKASLKAQYASDTNIIPEGLKRDINSGLLGNDDAVVLASLTIAQMVAHGESDSKLILEQLSEIDIESGLMVARDVERGTDKHEAVQNMRKTMTLSKEVRVERAAEYEQLIATDPNGPHLDRNMATSQGWVGFVVDQAMRALPIIGTVGPIIPGPDEITIPQFVRDDLDSATLDSYIRTHDLDISRQQVFARAKTVYGQTKVMGVGGASRYTLYPMELSYPEYSGHIDSARAIFSKQIMEAVRSTDRVKFLDNSLPFGGVQITTNRATPLNIDPKTGRHKPVYTILSPNSVGELTPVPGLEMYHPIWENTILGKKEKEKRESEIAEVGAAEKNRKATFRSFMSEFKDTVTGEPLIDPVAPEDRPTFPTFSPPAEVPR